MPLTSEEQQFATRIDKLGKDLDVKIKQNYSRSFQQSLADRRAFVSNLLRADDEQHMLDYVRSKPIEFAFSNPRCGTIKGKLCFEAGNTVAAWYEQEEGTRVFRYKLNDEMEQMNAWRWARSLEDKQLGVAMANMRPLLTPQKVDADYQYSRDEVAGSEVMGKFLRGFEKPTTEMLVLDATHYPIPEAAPMPSRGSSSGRPLGSKQAA